MRCIYSRSPVKASWVHRILRGLCICCINPRRTDSEATDREVLRVGLSVSLSDLLSKDVLSSSSPGSCFYAGVGVYKKVSALRRPIRMCLSIYIPAGLESEGATNIS